MRVAAGNYQREEGPSRCGGFFELLLSPRLFEQHGVDVAFEMIHADERFAQRKCQRLGEADTHQQRSGEAGAFCNSHGINILVG